MKTLNQTELCGVSGGYGQPELKTIRIEPGIRNNPIIRWIPDGSPQKIACEAVIIGALMIARHVFDRKEVPPVIVAPPGAV